MYQSITYHSFHQQCICLNRESYVPKDIGKFKPERQICLRSERQPVVDKGIESRSPITHISTITTYPLSSSVPVTDIKYFLSVVFIYHL